MYHASEAYIEQMMHHGTRRRLTGTIGDIQFTGEDIVRGSFSITNRASEESDTRIGGVYLGEIEMTFVPSFLTKLARDQYQDKEVAISIGLWVPDEEAEDGGAWEDIPVGIYTLQAPKISKQGITVNGYDNMKKLDKPFTIDQTTAAPYNYLQFIADQCHITLGNTQEEIEAMPNGADILPLQTEEGNDIETCRDCLYWIAQALGGFATANRAGEIEIRKFGNPTGIEMDEMHRDTDVVFSGYETKWTGIYITDTASQAALYYGLEIDDGLTMNLGENPFLQQGSASAVERRRLNVLNAIAQIRYTPFYCNSARDPIFDLGDEIPFTGGISGDSTGCLMAYTYKLDSFTFEGYGDDPASTNAQTKQDKNISGIKKSTTKNEVTYYNFANGTDITILPEHEVTIASLAFTSAEKTTVKIMHEFIFDFLADLATEGSYELKYYLDDELLPYHPYERIGAIEQLTEGDTTEASITRDFYYIIRDVEADTRHTWQVSIITHGIEETTIQRDHAHITLEGQRMYSDKVFDGYIEAKDSLTVIPIANLVPISITDSVAWEMIDVDGITAGDNVQQISISGLQDTLTSISETVDIFMETCVLGTEDDFILTTEDGTNLSAE